MNRKVYTATDVAKMIGITPRAVVQRARKLGVGIKGSKDNWAFTDYHIHQLTVFWEKRHGKILKKRSKKA